MTVIYRNQFKRVRIIGKKILFYVPDTVCRMDTFQYYCFFYYVLVSDKILLELSMPHCVIGKKRHVMEGRMNVL